jgi:outer membrane protein TolC
MKKYCLSGLALCLAVASTEVRAESNAGSFLSLDSLVQEALIHNAEIKAAEHRWQAAVNRPTKATTLPDPVLSYTRFGQSVETRLGPQESVLSLAQTLPFPGKLGFSAKMADRDAFRDEQKYQATRRDVVFSVKTAYYDLARLEESLGILNHYMALLRDFTRVAEQKYATGQGIQAHVLKAQVEISSILERQLLIQKMRFSNVAKLNRLVGKSETSPLASPPALEVKRIALGDSVILNTALSEREELKSLQALVQKHEFGRKLAGRNYWPDLRLQGNYITVSEGRSTAPDAGRNAWSVMAGINLPIWLGGRKAAQRESTELLTASRFALEDTEISVRAEVADLLNQLAVTAQSLNLYQNGLLTQAQSSLESAIASYGTGRLDFLDLLDAERMLLNLELSYVREKADYMKQRTALERAVGGTLPE